MLRCQILWHVSKALFFIKIALKLRYFCKKMQNFRALGAPPPDPLFAYIWQKDVAKIPEVPGSRAM